MDDTSGLTPENDVFPSPNTSEMRVFHLTKNGEETYLLRIEEEEADRQIA